MNNASILTNSAALSALMSLNQTETALTNTQNQISTGLAVASAADNSAYWSIATQLSSTNGVITSVNQALAQSQAVLSTANSAINSVITTINSIQSALTQAQNPGANIGAINTTLNSLASQLSDAVNGASFNGLNLLNGSVTAPLSFVSGVNQTASGNMSINTISFTAQALTGTSGVTTTTQLPTITNSTTISQLSSLADNSATVTTASYGQDKIVKGNGTLTITSVALDGTSTTTTYTALDANGNVLTPGATAGITGAAQLQVSQTTTTGSGILSAVITMATSGVTSSTASAALTTVASALSNVTTYAAVIGATQDRMTAANTFNSALGTDYTNGVSSLVDANMNEASTRLNALQTQQQLGIQALSIANQNSQLILKLFQG